MKIALKAVKKKGVQKEEYNLMNLNIHYRYVCKYHNKALCTIDSC
jgi:multimeric flavodoxin WrbA